MATQGEWQRKKLTSLSQDPLLWDSCGAQDARQVHWAGKHFKEYSGNVCMSVWYECRNTWALFSIWKLHFGNERSCDSLEEFVKLVIGGVQSKDERVDVKTRLEGQLFCACHHNVQMFCQCYVCWEKVGSVSTISTLTSMFQHLKWHLWK